MTAAQTLEHLKSTCTVMESSPVLLRHKFGLALKQRRLASGLSLREIAMEIGLSAAFLCDCEHGARSLSDGHAQAFIKATNKRRQP